MEVKNLLEHIRYAEKSPEDKMLTNLYIYELRREGILSRKLTLHLLSNGLANWQVTLYDTWLRELAGRGDENNRELLEAAHVLAREGERVFEKAQYTLALCQMVGCSTVLLGEEDYPELLAACADAPIVLFYQGNLAAYHESEAYLGVVGSRKMTAYGQRFLAEALPRLVGLKIAVISGLARGIDTRAHELTLRHGGFTVACLAHGLDTCYPPEHWQIKEEIAENGLLISEHAPGVPALKSYFSARNRLISGLAEALFLVEAGQKSGALITAEFAANQGRDVLALPGSIYWPSSAGCNRLIRDGATPVLDYGDILMAFGLDHFPLMMQENIRKEPLLAALAEGEKTEEELQAILGLGVTDLRIKLTGLEAEGLVFKTKGRYFLTSL